VSRWAGAAPPPPVAVGAAGWLRAAARGATLSLVVFAGLALTLLLRMIERPLFGLRRPVTPAITVAVCRAALAILGIGVATTGRPMPHAGAVVANHCSWLDIFVLNARKRIYFVAKAEVAGWAVIGWLARATGTVFIRRDRAAAADQAALLRARLRAGHRLLFFPEGTSTDGRRVLPFKTTLFAAFFEADLPDLHVQPVTVAYSAPPGRGPAFYAWFAEMEFVPHLLQVLAAPAGGRVTVTYHAPLRVADHASRKSLARTAEAQVRAALDAPAGLSRAR